MTIAIVHYGTSGTDEFVFFNDVPIVDVVYAGGGADIIEDGRGDPWSPDKFFGESGADRIVSLSGNDWIDGGTGADSLKVRCGQYNAADFLGAAPGPDEWFGFEVTVKGGSGFDTLRVTNAEGYSIEVDGDTTVITTRFGGTITVTGVEEFEFIL